jgi:F-type H+-transporting ATPase subunit b
MKLIRQISLTGILLLAFSCAFAQTEPASSEPKPAPSQAPASAPAAEQSNSMGEQLAHASNAAAGEEGKGEEEEGAEFKQSGPVKAFARVTGLGLHTAYWVLVAINFLIIALLVLWGLKKNLPGMFKARTETIRKSMDEARHASEDANRRLSDIESRLGRLDSEIAQMKSQAEADAVAEEQRIRAAAEEERKHILASTEQEIEAVARAARRELKAYAAELAVSLAEKRITVDAKTDEALVHTFIRELGKDSRR